MKWRFRRLYNLGRLFRLRKFFLNGFLIEEFFYKEFYIFCRIVLNMKEEDEGCREGKIIFRLFF